MNDADSEWRKITQKQRAVSNYKTSAEFFSIQKFVAKMMQNLKNGGMHRITDQLAAMDIPAGSTVLDIRGRTGNTCSAFSGVWMPCHGRRTLQTHDTCHGSIQAVSKR